MNKIDIFDNDELKRSRWSIRFLSSQAILFSQQYPTPVEFLQGTAKKGELCEF